MKSPFYPLFIRICLLSILFPAVTLFAGEVTRDQAVRIASQVVSRSFPAGRPDLQGAITIGRSLKPDDPFFVCNVGNQGYVLVSRSDKYPPVLGFSWEGAFPSSLADAPGALTTVLDNIGKRCREYSDRDSISPAVAAGWEYYTGNTAAGLKTGIIAPLLTTSWNVDASFFNMFPKDYKAGGSVPIAMGQVFRYYARPEFGTGELCYILNGYGELCTKIDRAWLRFDRMSNTQGNPAVDSLVYYMSVTCMMQPEGASLYAYKQTLPVHFGYSNDMRAVEPWEYNLVEVLLHQLSLRHPVPAEWLDHSFVIDGYFPGNLFHFNMGLGGPGNGFFLIDNPVADMDRDRSLLTIFTDYRPRSVMPAVTDLNAVPEGDSIRISWNAPMPDSIHGMLQRFIVLRDGLIPIAQSTGNSVLVSPAAMGGSSKLRVVSDFGTHGSSDLSLPFVYISNPAPADIPSLALRQLINTKLGSIDLLKQPSLGELELIRDLEITFADQRGLEKLPKLTNLRIDGTNIRTLRDGDYIGKLRHLRFFKCIDFDYTMFSKTRSLYQLYGYDYLPMDLYEFRHNTDLGLLIFTTTGTNPNQLMDLYGADKYFPKLADFMVRHLSAGISANYEDCFVSYESYLDIYPKIKWNQNLMAHTNPTSFAPCYPVPSRNVNQTGVTRLSWQSNFQNKPDVFYNVFVGNDRKNMELLGIFQTDKFYDGVFEPNKDYYWRVEAYHADSTYYSGIWHFSTWQDLPIPFIDRFNDYYTNCVIADESPFWETFDARLTGKAVANRNVVHDGNYSMELKPKSDIGVQMKTPKDSKYYIEFRFLNHGGDVTAELLQKNPANSENIVNSFIRFMPDGTGTFNCAGDNGDISVPLQQKLTEWNRINIALNMTTGQAVLSFNEEVIKEWQWKTQLGGFSNPNPFKGIRFVNKAAADTASGFIDNMIIDLKDPSYSNPLILNNIGLFYRPMNHEVLITGIEPGEIRDIILYDLQGRKLGTRTNPVAPVFPIGSALPNGIYLVMVNPKNGTPFTGKILISE